MIKFSIINGGGTGIDIWNWMGKRDIQLRELYLIECYDCCEPTTLMDGGRKHPFDNAPADKEGAWVCFNCWEKTDED